MLAYFYKLKYNSRFLFGSNFYIYNSFLFTSGNDISNLLFAYSQQRKCLLTNDKYSSGLIYKNLSDFLFNINIRLKHSLLSKFINKYVDTRLKNFSTK